MKKKRGYEKNNYRWKASVMLFFFCLKTGYAIFELKFWIELRFEFRIFLNWNWSLNLNWIWNGNIWIELMEILFNKEKKMRFVFFWIKWII